VVIVSWPIKLITIEGDYFTISNYFTSHRAPIAHLANVTENNISRLPTISLYFEPPTQFGKRIRIIPPQGLFTSNYSAGLKRGGFLSPAPKGGLLASSYGLASVKGTCRSRTLSEALKSALDLCPQRTQTKTVWFLRLARSQCPHLWQVLDVLRASTGSTLIPCLLATCASFKKSEEKGHPWWINRCFLAPVEDFAPALPPQTAKPGALIASNARLLPCPG
jgi:hypothetical protein